MCGFIGAVGCNLRAIDLKASLDTIRHRGPDGQQLFTAGPLCLAACRLSIRPPFTDPPIFTSDSTAFVLNGEVYDLEPASTQPKSDLPAAPQTDTRLLANALRQKGLGILPSLTGLFAFCFWDGRRVVLVRDRFGIKPLYFANFLGGLVFASEMRGLLALPGFSRDPDPDVLSAFSVVGHNIFLGRTPFRDIQSLEPGCSLSYSPEAGALVNHFAPVPTVPPAGFGLDPDPVMCGEETERLLSASVRRAAFHDPHPKAVFFSGGIDSSLLLDMSREHGPTTAYVLSDRDDADDLLQARRVALALDVPLCEQRVDEFGLARETVHYAWHFEHPIAGGAFDVFGGVAFHALSRTIAADFKVALCGEGADELFLGYHRLHMQPSLFLDSLRQREPMMTGAVRDWLCSKQLLGEGTSANQSVRSLALSEGLTEYHLPSVDRSGMAFGLEIRPPYLDNQLAAWAVSLNEKVLIDRTDRWTKLPLREIARRRFKATGTERVAIRRKWAMPSAVQICARRLAALLDQPSGEPVGEPVHGFGDLNELLSDLFWHLHVDPGYTSVPDFSLLDFARDVRQPRGRQ